MTFIRKISRVVIDFCCRSSVYGVTRGLILKRAELDAVFFLLVLGNGVGVPIFPPYYSPRLWPHLLPRMASWKRALLRPKGLGNWGTGGS